MWEIGMALFGCAVLVVIAVKVFGHYLFNDPCEGDGNYNPPMDMFYYEDEDEDDTEHRRKDVT